MNLVIKQTSPEGRDTKMFRAYLGSENPGRCDEPLGVCATTTGNAEFGAEACAMKALAKLTLGDAHRAEEFRGKLSVRELVRGAGVWRVHLASKDQEAEA